MTEPNPGEPHQNSTAALLRELIEATAAELKIDLRTGRGRTLARAIRDAFEVGKLGPTAANPVKPSATPVVAGDKAGMFASAVHTISAEKIAEHGPEVAITAYLRHAMRELAANGCRPDQGSSFEVVGMLDGTIVVTAEAMVGS